MKKFTDFSLKWLVSILLLQPLAIVVAQDGRSPIFGDGMDFSQRAAFLAQIPVENTRSFRTLKKITAIDKSDSLIAQTNQQLMAGINTAGFQQAKTAGITITQQQQSALSALVQQTPGGVKARFSKHGTLSLLRPGTSMVKGKPMYLGPISALGKARRFLHTNKILLKLQSPEDSLTLADQHLDSLNQRHLKFEQTIDGIRLWGKEVIVHLDSSGEVYQLNGHYLPDGQHLNAQPGINETDAIEASRADLRVQQLIDATAELVFYTDDQTDPVLAWKVDARPSLYQWFYYFVDAVSGEVIHRINNIHKGSVEAARGTDLFGRQINFNSWFQDNVFFMLDPTFPINDVTADYDPVNRGLNSRGDTIVLDARNGESELFFVTNDRANGGWDRAAVSVIDNAKTIFDYYLGTHNRNSLDNNGMNLQSIVHFGRNVANAFWNGQFMVYGDGDGKVLGQLASCLDVAAHEMTHGVIQHTANLIYENQSGALNESFADVFAILIDDDDWLLGEDCTIAQPGYTRSLQNPNSGLSFQPDRYSDYQNLPNTEQGDYGGVHINSGIPNKAFYLTASDIGRPDAGRIYYRALTTYLTSSSTFIDAREALEQSATDLFGANSTERQAVSNAWDSVEVTGDNTGETGSSRPTVTDPVAGDDLLAYLRPINNNFNAFHVYRQTLQNPFAGYQESADIGPLNSVNASPTAPSVFTNTDGTFITYVGTDFNLHVIQPGSNAQNIAVSDTGTIRTAAVSPDGRYIAYSTIFAVDDSIHVVDTQNSTTTDYKIILPNFQQEQTASATSVRYADSLSFDYTGEKIIFDVLLCTPLPEDDCQDDPSTGYNYWSVGTLDLAKQGKFDFPFPSQSPLISLGYPRFASNNNFVSIMDVVAFNTETEMFESGAYTYHFENQALAPVALLAPSSQELFTSPSFWGDDDYASFSFPDFNRGQYVTARVAVSEESDWKGADTAMEVNPNNSVLPIMHRTGVRVVNRDLQVNRNTLDFGSVSEGSSKNLALTLSNKGNSDVDINSITTTSDRFKHNGINGRLPRGESMDITVTFTAGSEKNNEGNLIINSTGNPDSISVSLTGTNPQGQSSGGGGGNGTVSPMFLIGLLILGIFGIGRGRGRVRDCRQVR